MPGLFAHLFQKSGDPPKKRKTGVRRRLQTPEEMTSGVRSSIVRDTLKTLPKDERLKLGRVIIGQMVGSESDPDKLLLQEALDSDPEVKAAYLEILLEKKRAEIVGIQRGGGRGRSRARDDDDDDDYRGRGGGDSEFGIFGPMAQELIMEKLMGGGEKSGGLDIAGIIKGLAAVVAPMLLAQHQPPQTGQVVTAVPQPSLPTAQPAPTVAQPVPQPTVAQASPQPEPEPVASGQDMLFDVLSAQRVQELLTLAETDPTTAAKLMLTEVATKLADHSAAEQIKVRSIIEMMCQISHNEVCLFLSQYGSDPEWASVIAYIQGHEEVFGNFQTALTSLLFEDEDESSEAS